MIRIAALAVLGVVGASAQASLVGNPLKIVAESSLGRAEYVVTDHPGDDFEFWSWTMGRRVEMKASNGSVVAVLENLDMFVFHDPVVSINFTAVAGAAATVFTVYSGELTFPALTGASGIASAGLTVTDRNGDGAQLTGSFTGKAHRANYNGDVAFGMGVTFGDLVSGIVTGPFGTNIGAESVSGLIPVPVTSMSAGFEFTLSANDSVGGTSVFQVIPTPGAVAVAGLGGLLAARRRRLA